MASPATSVARTQRSVGVPRRKRYSLTLSLETAATEGCDWSAYTKPELRALIESAAKILGGATRELKSRKPSFPDSLSPHLIMAWLPLGDIPYALRVSNPPTLSRQRFRKIGMPSAFCDPRRDTALRGDVLCY